MRGKLTKALWQKSAGQIGQITSVDVAAENEIAINRMRRNLTPPDVQKIAEAFLLWNGNHAWKVVDVAATPDGAIGFGLATQEGSLIARFTMDPHSGRVTRVG